MAQSSSSTPCLRWGIIGTGTGATWLVRDLLLSRPKARAVHVIHAIASKSKNGPQFAKKLGVPLTTKIYDSYEELYSDPDVDIIHMAIPHGLHLEQCLAAIGCGKHILCEKPFAMNAKEARIIFEAASKANVWIGEGIWTRALPVTKKLLSVLHEERPIGKVLRVVSDFGFRVDLLTLAPGNRYRTPALGAGSLMDIGVYLINWALLAVDDSTMNMSQESDTGEGGVFPKITAMQSLETLDDGSEVEVASGMVMQFDKCGPQAMLSSTTVTTREKGAFLRIDGTDGHITVEGPAPPLPTSFTVYTREAKGSEIDHERKDEEGQTYSFESPGGMGFYWEADEAALDIAAGRTRSSVMPWTQTMRVLRIMDEIRRQGGAKFPQDK